MGVADGRHGLPAKIANKQIMQSSDRVGEKYEIIKKAKNVFIAVFRLLYNLLYKFFIVLNNRAG
jgi:hypothetical protein